MTTQARPSRSDLDIPLQAVQHRMALDNPWWRPGHGIDPEEAAWPRRAQFARFAARLRRPGAGRPVVVSGPRRIGKTVFLKHVVAQLLADGTPGGDVLFLPLDTPLYAGPSLANLLSAFVELRRQPPDRPLWLLVDEVQYAPDWARQLVALTQRHPALRVVAAGSATAVAAVDGEADTIDRVMLPPLSFAEYLRFAGIERELVREQVPGRGGVAASAPLGCGSAGGPVYVATEIHALNTEFVHYLNYGGFPEAVMNPAVRDSPARFLRQEIVDKVLLKDLPGLAGIGDTRALNRVFSVLAWHTGSEIGLEELSRQTGVGKLKLADHLGYLESAGLLQRVHRLDDDGARMQRERTFRVHLTNPAMRAALFGLVAANDPAMDRLCATAIWSQWLHAPDAGGSVHCMRWKAGRQTLEVDLVALDAASHRPRTAVSVQWLAPAAGEPDEPRALRALAQRHPLGRPPLLATRTQAGFVQGEGVVIERMPAALLCYTLGRELLRDGG